VRIATTLVVVASFLVPAITPKWLIKVIANASLKAIREDEKASDGAQQSKNRDFHPSASLVRLLLGLVVH
jgi:hypothetical protein